MLLFEWHPSLTGALRAWRWIDAAAAHLLRLLDGLTTFTPTSVALDLNSGRNRAQIFVAVSHVTPKIGGHRSLGKFRWPVPGN